MSNPYKRLLNLLPQYPLQVGTVLSVTDNIAQIELPDGAILIARGNATAGQQVFVRDNVIEGQAPSLPVYYSEI